MVLGLSDSERQLLRQDQRAGGVRAVAAIAEALGLNESTVYRYAHTYREKGLAGYLAAEQPGYWDPLTSA